jgi:hypothetical protein
MEEVFEHIPPGCLMVGFGSIAEVHGGRSTAKITAVFTDRLMPWPKHFFPKTFGDL